MSTDGDAERGSRDVADILTEANRGHVHYTRSGCGSLEGLKRPAVKIYVYHLVRREVLVKKKR
jgi:hypothetical protein